MKNLKYNDQMTNKFQFVKFQNSQQGPLQKNTL
jgi:hypothetical protein